MKSILFLCLILNLHILAGTETVSLDFELNETAINRALVSQFNDPNFIFKHFTDEFEFESGVVIPYDIQLSRPTVEIDDNSIGIHLQFNVSLPSLGYNYELDITPDLNIDEQSIKASEVVAFIKDLDDEINNYQDIPQSVRILLIGLYETYEPQVYASSLYNEILDDINSSDFIAQRAFSVTNFGLSFVSTDGKCILKILLYLTSGDTAFYGYVDPSSNFIRIGSNIKCIIKEVVFYTLGDEIYSNNNLNIEMTSNPNFDVDYFAQLNLNDFAVEGEYELSVLFETNETFYYNKFVLPSYHWQPTSLRINH